MAGLLSVGGALGGVTAGGIISTILDFLQLSPAAQDVVAVYDASFAQKFADAIPVKALVKEGATFMTHPVETGEVISDHRVIDPIEIELVLISKSGFYASVYQEIKQTFLKAEPLSVQTKVGTYANLYIQDMPHSEEVDMFDAVKISVKLREVQFVDAQYSELPPSKTKDKKDSDTVKRGTQTPKTPDAAQATKAKSTLFEIFN